jgi:DNA-binding LytR/AlgR family response regulator
MNVLIIEDEKPAADKLKRMLADLAEEITILGTLETVEGSINWFMNNPAPDLVFMDIQLNDGISFDIFESVKITAPVIFTTAYDEYAIRAFKVNSIDYLLKPIDQASLVQSLEKYRNLYPAGRTDHKKIDLLYNQLVKKFKTRFFIKFGAHCRSVITEDIKYFFILERSTFMKTFPGKIFDVDYSLDQLERMLDPEKFFRINRKFIINVAAIADIIAWSSSRLKLKLIDEEDTHDLVVSREKVSEFKKMLDR